MKKLILALLILSLSGCELVNNLESNNTYLKNNDQSSIEDIEEESSSEKENHEENNLVNSNIFFNESYDNWLNETKEDKYVITLIGASYCGHCTSFKPVLEKVATKYGLDLYFYYINEIDSAEKEKILNEYETNFEGAVPHLFITKDGSEITNITRGMSEEELIEFLKLNLIIE